MSLTHSKSESIHDIRSNSFHHHPTSNNDYTVIDLLFMWENNPAFNLTFLLNRAMELVGYKSQANLFYIVLGGHLDYNYDLASKKILRVASQYGNYFYSFWYDLIHE